MGTPPSQPHLATPAAVAQSHGHEVVSVAGGQTTEECAGGAMAGKEPEALLGLDLPTLPPWGGGSPWAMFSVGVSCH